MPSRAEPDVRLRSRRSLLFAAVTAALSALLGCSGEPAAPPRPPVVEVHLAPARPLEVSTAPQPEPLPSALTEWKVGAYLSLSGVEGSFGVETREGIDLAVGEVNDSGGVRGKPLRVVYENDGSSPTEASARVLDLIERHKVIALLGEVSSARSKAGGIVANSKGIPMITPSSTHPDVTKVGPFVFRACFTDDAQGRAAASFAVKDLGKKKLAILYASDVAYSTLLANAFRAEAKRLGAKIAVEKTFLQSETSFATYLKDIQAQRPEIVYVPTYYTSVPAIARQAKAAGIPANRLLGADGWDGMEAEELAKLEGARLTSQYVADNPAPRQQAFVKSYKARHGHEPSALAATGYDAAALLADAIGRAKDDTPDAVREAIAQTKDFHGVTGDITIDAERNPRKPVIVVEIKGGAYRFHSVVQP
jgi:branched-chain amino acid transport system substrate-binding protein